MNFIFGFSSNLKENVQQEINKLSPWKLELSLPKHFYTEGEKVHGIVHIFPAEIEKNETKTQISRAALQIHGHIKIDPRWINLSKSIRNIIVDGQTTENEEGKIPSVISHYREFKDENIGCILVSKPCIFLHESTLSEQGYAMEFCFTIPRGVPPTFRGVGCKYFYVLSASIKRKGKKEWSYMHLPINIQSEGPKGVLPPVPIIHQCQIQHNALELWSEDGSESAEGPEVLPLLAIPSLENEPSQVSLREEEHLGYPSVLGRSNFPGEWQLHRPIRSRHEFNITDDQGDHLCIFSLQKMKFVPGEVILGTFDFSRATVQCLQVWTSLQSHEALMYSVKGKHQRRDVKETFMELHKNHRSPTHNKLHDSFHSIPTFSQLMHFDLSVPLHACGTFSTQIMSHSWDIVFEFLIRKGSYKMNDHLHMQNGKEGNKRRHSSSKKLNKLKWNTTITVGLSDCIQEDFSADDGKPHISSTQTTFSRVKSKLAFEKWLSF